LQVYEGELARVRKENGVLRDQLQRCHLELRYYQVKYPNDNVQVDSGEHDELPPWVTSAEHMTPLLQVYDERIAELQKELSHQRDMVDSFQEKVSAHAYLLLITSPFRWKKFLQRMKLYESHNSKTFNRMVME
jgi:hypothetical protein